MKLNRLLFTTFMLLFFIYLAFSTYTTGDKPWIFFNSDNGIPYLYQDLMERGGHILQWKFAAVNNLFPDIIFFFLLAAITQHIRVAMVLFGALQLIAYFCLSLAIGKKIIKRESQISLLSFSLITSVYLLTSGNFTHKEIVESALTSWLHFGTTLMYLVGVWCVLNTYQSKRMTSYVVLFFLCMLTTFSDLLYITQFPVPVLMTLALLMMICGEHYKKIHIKNIIAISLGTAVGYLFYKFNPLSIGMNHEGKILKRIHWSDLHAALNKLQIVFAEFYQHNAILLFSLAVFVVYTSLYLYRLLTKKISQVDVSFSFVMIMFLMSIGAGFCSLIFLDNDLMAGDYSGLRHYQPFIIFPVFIGVPLWLCKKTDIAELLSKQYYFFLITMAVCAYLCCDGKSINRILNFYPESVACLDQYAEQYHLENGLANYWEAKSYSFLSKKHVNIVAVNPDMKPYLNINTENDYKNKKFTFVIVQDPHTLSPSYPPGDGSKYYVNRSQMVILLGKPVTVLECPSPLSDGKEKIYIFNEGVISLGSREQQALRSR